MTQETTLSYYELTERLEVAAMHRQVVDLHYLDVEGQRIQLKSFVSSLTTQAGQEGVLFRDGTFVPFKQILSINGEEGPNNGLDMMGCRCGI